MAVICCSKDDVLSGKLLSLFGESGVVFIPDIRLLGKRNLAEGEVLVVDIKHSKIPEGSHISLPIIALTVVPTFPEAVMLLQRGIRGYGNRHMRQENLDQAVKSVKAGQIWLPPAIISQLIASVGTENIDQSSHDILSKLSRREQEVALYVTEGMTNQQMADKMYVSLRTVKAHMSSIYDKTGLRNRLELGLRLKEDTRFVNC
ncbi:response regulator transcription factor [Desulfopila sp. IMCC35006]|uniref:response regulator transcription factor n=1 Tax=Desulfopila sp. IMCC35006 TaxID=2569542 RepID=UPI0010ACDB17|nr:response regulator transcription factor [Desulfopila sp. IMCC35006]TKB24505.1 response regulator transcription factor [Desulfopila sp. IMCC35006]